MRPPAQSRPDAVARDLLLRAEEDKRLSRIAIEKPSALHRQRLATCRRANAAALDHIVRNEGWPGRALVGEVASTAALMLLLHADDLAFQLRCRDLITAAVERGDCPRIHHAYIVDHCAVEQRIPQTYGTRVATKTALPYAIDDPESVDERRRAVGLPPLAEQTQALRQQLTGRFP
ncbi:DUF6624 domain-containing protein [Streptomyces sp. NPDC048172]|uniref:DUF6624 domain-containing protein n=1 Tax=Streptomyces sp. NPDC048172 TaxID=3365505 RepID=UPI00371EAD73